MLVLALCLVLFTVSRRFYAIHVIVFCQIGESNGGLSTELKVVITVAVVLQVTIIVAVVVIVVCVRKRLRAVAGDT